MYEIACRIPLSPLDRIDGFAIGSSDSGEIIDRLTSSFDLEADDSGIGKILEVIEQAHVPGIHDVGPEFIFVDREELSLTLLLFKEIFSLQQLIIFRSAGILIEIVAFQLVLEHPVFPSAGVGTGTLIRVAMRKVIREEASSGICHADSSVDEEFKLHVRAIPVDLPDLAQGNLPGKDDPFDSDLLPEFHLGPIRVVRLDRKMDLGFRVLLADHIDEPGIRHDEGIGAKRIHPLECMHEWLDLNVVRVDIRGEVDLLSSLMAIGDRFGKVVPGELILPGPKREHGNPGIHRICTVGDGVFHLLQIARRHEEFQFLHRFSG